MSGLNSQNLPTNLTYQATLLADIDAFCASIEQSVESFPRPLAQVRATDRYWSMTRDILESIKSDQNLLKNIATNLLADLSPTRVFSGDKFFDRKAYGKNLLKRVISMIDDDEFLKAYSPYVEENKRMAGLQERFDKKLAEIVDR